jgi:hypothetical protein
MTWLVHLLHDVEQQVTDRMISKATDAGVDTSIALIRRLIAGASPEQGREGSSAGGEKGCLQTVSQGADRHTSLAWNSYRNGRSTRRSLGCRPAQQIPCVLPREVDSVDRFDLRAEPRGVAAVHRRSATDRRTIGGGLRLLPTPIFIRLRPVFPRCSTSVATALERTGRLSA